MRSSSPSVTGRAWTFRFVCLSAALVLGCSRPVAKIQLDLDSIEPDGLRGAAGGRVSVAYELCVPATQQVYVEVRRIEPALEIHEGSAGRVGCAPNQALVLGTTNGIGWRAKLEQLAALPYVAEIREAHFE